MMRGRCCALALALAVPAAASAQPVDAIEQDDALVLSVTWRLEAANARYCRDAAPGTGIQLQDTAAYNDPGLARRTYGLAGDIYIGALADTGPGTAAGLTVNMTVTAIDGQSLAALPAPPAADPFARLHRLQAMLDDAAAAHGAVTLTLAEGRTVAITAVPACRVAIRAEDQTRHANATREEIRVGRRHLALARGDRAVIAAMIAHELAHAVLDHETLLAAAHQAADAVRLTEREADRLSVWLMANAGYPPEAALTFQRTVIARSAGPLAIDPLHGSWRERTRIIAAEIAVLKAAPDLDWPRRFVRESR
jgi:beta-barrel assembly-enhancing protease